MEQTVKERNMMSRLLFYSNIVRLTFSTFSFNVTRLKAVWMKNNCCVWQMLTLSRVTLVEVAEVSSDQTNTQFNPFLTFLLLIGFFGMWEGQIKETALQTL